MHCDLPGHFEISASSGDSSVPYHLLAFAFILPLQVLRMQLSNACPASCCQTVLDTLQQELQNRNTLDRLVCFVSPHTGRTHLSCLTDLSCLCSRSQDSTPTHHKHTTPHKKSHAHLMFNSGQGSIQPSPRFERVVMPQ